MSTDRHDRNLVPIGCFGDNTELASFGAQHVGGTMQVSGNGSEDCRPQGARTRDGVSETVRAPLALGHKLTVRKGGE